MEVSSHTHTHTHTHTQTLNKTENSVMCLFGHCVSKEAGMLPLHFCHGAPNMPGLQTQHCVRNNMKQPQAHTVHSNKQVGCKTELLKLSAENWEWEIGPWFLFTSLELLRTEKGKEARFQQSTNLTWSLSQNGELYQMRIC